MYPSNTHQVPPKYPSTDMEVLNLIKVLISEKSSVEIEEILGLKDFKNFSKNYLEPLVTAEVIKMKSPNSPNHPKQRYLLAEKGNEIKKEMS